MNTIPADFIVAVTPGVLPAGGSGLNLNGMVVSNSDRLPLGAVVSFPSGSSVTSYFGGGSAEDVIANGGADLGAGYFDGFEGSLKTPSALLFTRYNAAPAAAWLRGGDVSGLSIAALQAISGTLVLTVDGSEQTGTIDLSAAASFSAAATAIETALNTSTAATGSVDANVVVGRIDPTTGVGHIDGTILTLTAASRAGFAAGQVISGIGVSGGTTILAQLTGTAGSTGTYTVSIAQTVPALTTITSASGTLVVSALTTGSLFVGQVISGTGVTAGTKVSAFLTGTGGTGSYAVDVSQTVPPATTITGTGGLLTISAVSAGTFGLGDVFTGAGVTAGNRITAFKSGTGLTGTYFCSVGDTAASTAISVAGADVDVSFDSISGGFLIQSGTTGVGSTTTFATGSASTALKLTSATGALLSQGAAPATPAGVMNAAVAITQNWAPFMTSFDPDGGSGFALKEAFAAWKNSKNNRYAYVCSDLDASPTTQAPATGSLGYALQQNGDSGTFLLWEPSNLNQSQLALAYPSSLDFSQKDGRTTMAFREQSGLLPGVTDETVAANLGGSPQQTASYGNGYNYYAAFATANDQFIGMQRGTVTGSFQWYDSYVDQIWMNSQFQLALMELLRNTRSIPYNDQGYGLISAALQDPINQALNFGAIRAGVPLSSAQVAEVNQAAGAKIDGVLFTRGWYLKIGAATAQTRQSRGTPPMTFWYMDGGSVQSFNLASILVQ